MNTQTLSMIKLYAPAVKRSVYRHYYVSHGCGLHPAFSDGYYCYSAGTRVMCWCGSLSLEILRNEDITQA